MSERDLSQIPLRELLDQLVEARLERRDGDEQALRREVERRQCDPSLPQSPSQRSADT